MRVSTLSPLLITCFVGERDHCTVCNSNSKQTLHHILSNCSSALEQGRYTWRHDSVLRTIFDFIRSEVKGGYDVFVDLSGHGAGNGGTIPPDVLVTTQRPDLFIVNRDLKKVILLELTVPWDMNIDSSHGIKSRKYASLIGDLERHFSVEAYCFEVSVRGLVSKANKARLKSFLMHSHPLHYLRHTLKFSLHPNTNREHKNSLSK